MNDWVKKLDSGTQMALKMMEDVLPEIWQGQQSIRVLPSHPNPRLVKSLYDLLQSREKELWPEACILMIRHHATFPALMWKAMAQKIAHEDFYHLTSALFPIQADSYFSDAEKNHVHLPLDCLDWSNSIMTLRFFQKHYAENQDIPRELAEKKWNADRSPAKHQWLNWLLKISPLDKNILENFSTKSESLNHKLELIRSRTKDSSYQLRVKEIALKWNTNLTSDEIGYLHFRDVIATLNTPPSLEKVSDPTFLRLIHSSLHHQDAKLAIHLLMKRERLLNEELGSPSYLQATTLEYWIIHLIRYSNSQSWIVDSLKQSDTYWTPKLSEQLINWTVSHWLAHPELSIIVKMAAIKADPKIYSTLLHFKEKNPFLGPQESKVLVKALEQLQLRWGIRRSFTP